MSGIRKESIEKIIDKNITDLIKSGTGVAEIVDNLNERSLRIKDKLYRDIKSCSELDGMDPDMLLYNEDYWDMVTSSRIKYSIYYTSHCFKRIDNIDWMVKNRLKLSEYTRLQLFGLVKLKELLISKSVNEKV